MAGPSFRQGDAEALFAALRAHGEGDEGPMERWDLEVRPGWLAVLRRRAPQCVDAEDLLQHVLLEACKTVLVGKPVKSPGGWLSTVALRRAQKLVRRREEEKEKEKENVRTVEVPDTAPTPFEVAADSDETDHEKEEVLEAARMLPQPYGHVLVWKVIEGLSWQEIRDRLNAHRPVVSRLLHDRQARIFITRAVRMLNDYLSGLDLRLVHHQKYLLQKNGWIGSTLPSIWH
jgi:RNA polymerase sigma factor (sigma-70 family)